MVRIYEEILRRHLREDRQMAMLTGPRQVGKTTTSRTAAGEHQYLTWDRQTDRLAITRGPDAVARLTELSTVRETPLVVVLEEIHKYAKWKTFLKGFFDVYGEHARIVVTGSARLGFFRRGADSLVGRYFLYRMHPLSVREIVQPELPEHDHPHPVRPDAGLLEHLLAYGGFPEPFTRSSTRFSNRWRRMRSEVVFREDLRDLTRTQEVGQVQVLAELIAAHVGGLSNYSALALDVSVSVDTVRRWIAALEGLFVCYRVRPWFKSVPKSIRKQPKIYLWDWSAVPDAAARRENLVASHLLKAAHAWTDIGLGDYALFYLRDKARREVDFLMSRDGLPWLLVEVKSSAQHDISPSLSYFQKVTGAKHAFQVAFDLPYMETDLLARTEPVRVPAITLLSQLV